MPSALKEAREIYRHSVVFAFDNQIMKNEEEEEEEKSVRDRYTQNQGNPKGDMKTQGSKALDSSGMVTSSAILG